MAESQHDDLADALARMAAGDIAPSEHEPEAPPQPPSVTTVRPASARPAVKPVAVQPATPPPKAPASTAPAGRPAAPVRARPVAPTLGAASPPPRATAPAPVAAPVARKARPSAPAVAAPANQPQDLIDGGQSTGLSPAVDDGQVIDDDDSVIVPAPDPSVFEYRSTNVAEARAKVARRRSLEFRRTLIPILLTFGALLIGFAALELFINSDSILVPAGLVFMAIVLLAFAALNMISVKKELESES